MDLHLLLTLLEAIERVCTHKKAKLETFKKASHKGKKGKMHPGTKLQHEWEGHDAHEHALASNFIGGDQTRLPLQEGQTGIFQEVFQKGWEREEAPWYQFYGQGSQEGQFWEALQPVQEAWGRVHHAQY